jgi:hypothetical protein
VLLLAGDSGSPEAMVQLSAEADPDHGAVMPRTGQRPQRA